MNTELYKTKDSFSDDAKYILELAGIAIAKHPDEVTGLLREYGVEIIDDTDEEEITEHLIEAIAENHKEFNRDLATLLIESFISEEEYENFDMQALQGAAGGKGGGLQVGSDPVGMIAGAVGSIFNFANAREQKKVAQEQAKATTIGGILNYKAEKEKTKQGKKKDKNSGSGAMIAAIGGGVVLLAIILFAMLRRPAAA